jgi:hypothetical protein
VVQLFDLRSREPSFFFEWVLFETADGLVNHTGRGGDNYGESSANDRGDSATAGYAGPPAGQGKGATTDMKLPDTNLLKTDFEKTL